MAKRRPNGDGLIRKRADGRWEGRIIVGHKNDGRPIFKSVLANTQKELIPKLNQIKELYQDANLTEDSNMTLAEWLDKWLEEFAKPKLRTSTLRNYTLIANHYIKPKLGEKKVSFISSADIQKMYNNLKMKGGKNGENISNTSVRKVHMMLHSALKCAVQEHLIPRNPTDGTTIPKIEYKNKRILSEAELEKFMQAIEKDELWHDFFYTAITTGLRRGEICGLKWSDFENGVLHIRRSVTVAKGGIIIGETKTDKGKRTIILPQSTIEILNNRRKNSISEWIFYNPIAPEKPINPSSAYHRLKKILHENSLPDIRFHDLRHTFATHALTSGVDAKTLSGILGHTNASFTLDTYTHMTTDMQKNAAIIVGSFIDKII